MNDYQLRMVFPHSAGGQYVLPSLGKIKKPIEVHSRDYPHMPTDYGRTDKHLKMEFEVYEIWGAIIVTNRHNARDHP